MGSFGKRMSLAVVPNDNNLMSRLLVHVEGQTEETFVNEVLGPHLYAQGYTQVSARLLGNARQRSHRGGARSWVSVRKEIINHLKADANCLVTTMVDFYGLPQVGQHAWPGRTEASGLPFADKAPSVKNAIFADIRAELGDGYQPDRFIPYVMMHEFEGLLFSDCAQFAIGVGYPDLSPQLQAVRDAFSSPEEINDSPQTAPSKRVKAIFAGYDKPLFGALAVLEIGLDSIRAECPHFKDWLECLEARGS